MLVAIEDVSDRETARRELAAAESHARGLFQHSPVSLWVEDFSSVKRLIDEVRACGIDDFRTFTDVHPEFVGRCMSEIRVIDVNRQTLETFRAANRSELLLRLHEVFRGSMQVAFREQLIDLWNGKLFQQREVVNYSLAGEELHFMMQFSVLPGHEAKWDLVQVALTDITARKKAEAYLEFLGKHDVLTKLYNRSFYVDEIARTERSDLTPTTIVIADLNGLKEANDCHGHAVGDQLLRRAGEVLSKTRRRPGARLAHRRRRIRHPPAGDRRTRRRRGHPAHPSPDRAEQSVLRRPAPQLRRRRRDPASRRADGRGRPPRRCRDVRGEAPPLRLQGQAALIPCADDERPPRSHDRGGLRMSRAVPAGHRLRITSPSRNSWRPERGCGSSPSAVARSATSARLRSPLRIACPSAPSQPA